MDKKRIGYIDIAKGITILLVILGHVLSSGWKRELIFSFHMPLFIICSGYFFKERSWKEEFKTLLRRLLFPYLIWLFIYILLEFITSNDCSANNFFESLIQFFRLAILSICSPTPGKLGIITNNIGGVGSLWFIPMLIVTRILFFAIKKISKKDDFFSGLLVIMISIVGYILGSKAYYFPFMIDVAMYALIFYFGGYLLHKHEVFERIKTKEFILVLLIWVIGFRFCWNELVNRNYPAFSIITAFAGTIVIIMISKFIEKKIKTRVITWIGNNSMNILGAHQSDTKILLLLGITNKSFTDTIWLNKLFFVFTRIAICCFAAFFVFGMKKVIIRTKMLLKNKKELS